MNLIICLKILELLFSPASQWIIMNCKKNQFFLTQNFWSIF